MRAPLLATLAVLPLALPAVDVPLAVDEAGDTMTGDLRMQADVLLDAGRDLACAQCIDTDDLRDGSVTLAKLAPGAVGTDQVVDRAVTAAKLAADALKPVVSLLGGRHPASQFLSFYAHPTSPGAIAEGALGDETLNLLVLRAGRLNNLSLVIDTNGLLAGEFLSFPVLVNGQVTNLQVNVGPSAPKGAVLQDLDSVPVMAGDKVLVAAVISGAPLPRTMAFAWTLEYEAG